MSLEIGASLHAQTHSLQTSVSAKSSAEAPSTETPFTLPPLDPVDISIFNVTNRNTDAGKIDEDPKDKMSIKDYIAYMLMLIDKLHKYKEHEPGPIRAKMEYRDELNSVLKQLKNT